MIEGGLNIQLGLSSFRRNYENREWREMGGGGTSVSRQDAKASRGERVKLGGVSEFGTQELMKERWGGGSGEQPCLPQRSPTFAKASAGKQSFTERGF